jgi:hypothetical protein
MIAPAYDDFGANPRASTYPSSLGPCSPKDPCLSSTPCRCSSWGRRGRGSRPVWPRSDPWPPPRLVSCGESSLRRRSPSRRPRIRAQSPPMQQQQSSSTYPPMLVRAPRELSLHTFRPWASDRILNKLSPRDLPGKHACHAADAILFCAWMSRRARAEVQFSLCFGDSGTIARSVTQNGLPPDAGWTSARSLTGRSPALTYLSTVTAKPSDGRKHPPPRSSNIPE